jgi:hypothetical protein
MSGGCHAPKTVAGKQNPGRGVSEVSIHHIVRGADSAGMTAGDAAGVRLTWDSDQAVAMVERSNMRERVESQYL